jgi:hypothetical protein
MWASGSFFVAKSLDDLLGCPAGDGTLGNVEVDAITAAKYGRPSEKGEKCGDLSSGHRLPSVPISVKIRAIAHLDLRHATGVAARIAGVV